MNELPAPLHSPPGAGVIDQDSAHDVRGHAIEVGPVFAFRCMADQPKEGFMYQGSWLQGVARSLAPQIGPGQTAQFGVNERRQCFESRPVPVRPLLQQPRDVVRRSHWHSIYQLRSTPNFRDMTVFNPGLRM